MPTLANAQQVAESAAWRQFNINGNTVSINSEGNPDGKRSYEVLAENDGLAVARLSVNRNGVLSDAWKADLDGNGAPEIIVAVGQLDGSNQGSVDVHEWDGYKFISKRLPQAIPSEKGAYFGHDQFKLENGQLIREFPRFKDESDGQIPSGEKARYRFDMQVFGWAPQ